jgi:hypothetical protein
MKMIFRTLVVLAFSVTSISSISAAPAEKPAPTPAPPSDEGWPREYSGAGGKIVIHEPQVDSWTDYTKLHYRAAIAFTPAGKKEVFGVVEGDADTEVDNDTRTVLINRTGYQLRFPDTKPQEGVAYEKSVREIIPESRAMVLALDRVLAFVDPAAQGQQPAVEVNLEPPKILYSNKPAILVIFMGEPQMKPVEKDKPDLLFAVNTNWDVFFDTADSKYYLLNGDNWLTATDAVKGAWIAAQKIPAALSKLPANDNWVDVIKNIPGKKAKDIPAVLVATEPTEMIVTKGDPAYTPIAGTKLLRVANTESTLFMDSTDKQFYFLAAGRWFRAANLSGPWSAASNNLPKDFEKLPDTSTVAFVKASVPGTEEAKDAVLLASVPRTTTVETKSVKLDVTYSGEPKFEPIKGANGVQFASNSPFAILLVNGAYYCCHKGAWYSGASPKGPWKYCTSLPMEIYGIPASHPLHNVTYVKVKSATDTTVVYTQTSGYSGEYVASNGVLMFGAGLLLGAAILDNYCYYCWPPYYYSYGCYAHYNYAYGGFYNAARYYGPYGGAAAYASYNPVTGTYSRGAYVYGPASSGSFRQAYNPYTDSYGARVTRQNEFGSSSRFYAERGNNSVWGGRESRDRGTVAWAQTNKDAKALAWDTKNSSGGVIKTKNDNTFVAKDGNVYKKDANGQWQKRENGNWTNINRDAERDKTITNKSDTRRPDSSKDQSRLVDRNKERPANTSFNRDTINSLDSHARARDKGNFRTQQVNSFQRSNFNRPTRNFRRR